MRHASRMRGVWMKHERNAPCPCGSGEKYKRCCAVNRTQRQWLGIVGLVLVTRLPHKPWALDGKPYQRERANGLPVPGQDAAEAPTDDETDETEEGETDEAAFEVEDDAAEGTPGSS